MFKPTTLTRRRSTRSSTTFTPVRRQAPAVAKFPSRPGDLQSLAELGFIVVCIDGMGTPFRSKSFHEAYYGDLGDNTIPDQVPA